MRKVSNRNILVRYKGDQLPGGFYYIRMKLYGTYDFNVGQTRFAQGKTLKLYPEGKVHRALGQGARVPGPRGPGPWAKGPQPLGQRARAAGPRGPSPWAKGPGPLGQGAQREASEASGAHGLIHRHTMQAYLTDT